MIIVYLLINKAGNKKLITCGYKAVIIKQTGHRMELFLTLT